MRIVFSCLLVVGFVNSGFSQVEVNRLTNIVQSVSTGSAGYGSGFKGTYSVKSSIKGDPYLDTAFRMSRFRLYKSTELIETPSRYDVLNNELEIRTTGGVMVLASRLVEKFTLLRSRKDTVVFVNSADYKYDDTQLIGFLQLLCDGKIQLLKQTRAEIVKPSYNPSLEVGDRDSHIVKKETLFYSLKGGEISKLKGKSEILTLFGDKKDLIKSFVSSNKLGFKSELDISKIFTYYNNLQ